MKKTIFITAALMVSLSAAALISGCTLAGLNMQKDYNRVTNVDTIDAHLNMTAWQYIKSKAYSNPNPKDTLFRRMYDAIIYSGIDTNEYIKPNRTYILLNNASVSTSKTGLWALVFTSANKAAKSWKDYSAQDVKNYLSYLILPASYSHYNLPVNDVSVTTLAPAGTYTNNPAGFKFQAAFYPNPNSTLLIRVQNAENGNSSDYPLIINSLNFVTTSDLLATNGVVQVMNTPVFPILPQ